MNKSVKFKMNNEQFKILVVGAGPAGASLAIRMAKSGFRVCLTEREKFPRHKLCGEFISPECLAHFRDLEVLDEMLEVGGDRVTETVFYATNGKSVSVASQWFGGEYKSALSISRAEMDFRLLEKAKKSGVKVLEETSVVGILLDEMKVCGVKARTGNKQTQEISADLTIDATGRASVITKFVEKEFSRRNAKTQRTKDKEQRTKLVGFKAHLENVNLPKGVCEIYSFRGGYGGLSYIENNLANHCFLVKADLVKEFSSNAQMIVENVIFKNARARETLKNSALASDWLAVSVDGFGRKNLCPAKNLFSVGDAAAFIDPFTGSGMLMALESAKILSRTIIKNITSTEKIAEEYKALYKQTFQKRLRVCSVLRHAAFMPHLAETVISVLSLSKKAREFLARSTRKSFQQ